MFLTYAQKFSLCETIEEILLLQEAEIKATGLEAAAKKKSLTDLATEAQKYDAAQEVVKAALVKATEKAVADLDKAYREASSTTDAIVVGMGSRVRNRIGPAGTMWRMTTFPSSTII